MPFADIGSSWELAKKMQSMTPYYNELKVTPSQPLTEEQGTALSRTNEMIRIVGTGGSGSRLIDYNFSKGIFETFKEGETTIPVHTGEPHWTRSLRMEMLDFRTKTETEISRLSTAVESLTRSLSTFSRDAHRFDSADSDLEDVHASNSVDVLDRAGMLNYLTNSHGLWNDDWQGLALASLTDQKPTIRAAAARALAAHAPEIALAELPKRVKVEHNRFVRSVLNGAIQAAAA